MIPFSARKMSKHPAGTALMLSCALSMASCNTSPSRPATPKTNVPAAFQEAGDAIADPTDGRAWWEAYGDPELSKLIGMGLSANADVRLAAARVDGMREGRRFLFLRAAHDFHQPDGNGRIAERKNQHHA